MSESTIFKAPQVAFNMVARTPTLLKKGILPNIHPAILGPKESQSLLNRLTSSFRNSLDKEHPWQSQVAPVVASKQTGGISKDPTQNHHATDRHLDSILTNPLFAKPTRPLVSDSLQKPFDVFDWGVSKGMMTPNRAAGFLAAVKNQIVSSASLDMRKSMAESGAGLRVLKWLRSSGLEGKLSFLNEPALVQNLVPFLFAASYDEIVWAWLSQLGSRLSASQHDVEAEEMLQSLLQNTLFWRKFDKDLDIEQALALDYQYSSLIRANQTLPVDHAAVLRNIRKHWTRLSWESTVNAWRYAKPSGPLYDLFVDMGRPWDRPVDFAHLELLHPTNPDHSSAVKYLHENPGLTEVLAGKGTKSYPRRMFSLGSDTVKRLEEVGQNTEAVWVKEFIEKTFLAWNRNLYEQWSLLQGERHLHVVR